VSEDTQQREWRVTYAALVVLVAAAFMYTLLPVLSPFILFIAVIILLAPFAGTHYHRAFLAAAAFLIFIWLLRTLASLLAPFILALVVAYILDPLVDRLQARGLKRPVAVAVLILPLITIAVLTAVFGIPALVHQAEDLIQKVPDAVQRMLAWIESSRARLERISWFRTGGGSRMLDSFSPERFAAYLQEQQAEILRRLWGGILGVGKGVGFALSLIGYLVLVPVLIIYLLLDFDGMTRRAWSLVPPRFNDRWLPLVREYDSLLGRYFRGQLIAALIVGLLTWLGLLILGFPYSGLVGAVAGVFNLVPYLGLIVSAVPALLIAVLSGNVVASLAKVAIVFFIVQLIDGTVTGPRIVGGSVGLHPVWVILVLAIGSFFFGFAGLLLAMPAGVLIKLLLREALAFYKRSRLYAG
jgi:predicted PurR-regulated permease PerM